MARGRKRKGRAKKEHFYDLSIRERELFEVLIDPKNMTKTYKEIAEVSGFSYGWVQSKISGDKEFMGVVNAHVKDLIQKDIYKVYQASMRRSLESKGFQDRKLLLTIFDDYSDKQEITHNLPQFIEDVPEDDK